ncbi:MAG: hypothetical protein ACI9KN_002141 [Gammaproteobacteria bacterium]|jgi:hypothetical protein
MALNFDQLLKFSTLILSIVIAVVGGIWNYTSYYDNERKTELETLINLGNAIAGMHVTCKGEFNELAELANEDSNSRKGRCYLYFQDAHRISLTAVITIKKPYSISAKNWTAYWDNLQNVIAAAGSQKYNFNTIEDAWAAILIAKQLKESPSEG